MKINSFLLLLTFCLTLLAQSNAATPAMVKVLDGKGIEWTFGNIDHKGNLLLNPKNAKEISLLTPQGEKQSQPMPAIVNSRPLVLSSGDILALNGKVLAISNGSVGEVDLLNSGVMYALDGYKILSFSLVNDDYFIFNLKGEILARAVLPRGSILKQTDGNFVIMSGDSVHFIDQQLKTRFTYQGNAATSTGNLIHPPSRLGMTKDGTLFFANLANEVVFLDAYGKFKAKYQGAAKIHSVIATPDGKVAALASDGYLYFMDTAGVVKAKHFHDSSKATSMCVVNSKTIAYWNSSELVFVDLQGKELETLPAKRQHDEARIMQLLDNRLVAADMDQFGRLRTLYFVKW